MLMIAASNGFNIVSCVYILLILIGYSECSWYIYCYLPANTCSPIGIKFAGYLRSKSRIRYPCQVKICRKYTAGRRYHQYLSRYQ